MNGQWDRDRGWRRTKLFGAGLALAFAVTLAAVVGTRLSSEALNVLAGAACGVGAAIPTSLLILTLTRRRDEARAPLAPAQSGYPPVVVISPPGAAQQSHAWPSPSFSMAPPAERQFTIVGGEAPERETISRR